MIVAMMSRSWGDRSVRRAADGLSMEAETLPPQYDLGSALVAAVKDAMGETDGDVTQAGPIVRQRMTVWAESVAPAVAASVRARGLMCF